MAQSQGARTEPDSGIMCPVASNVAAVHSTARRPAAQLDASKVSQPPITPAASVLTLREQPLVHRFLPALNNAIALSIRR